MPAARAALGREVHEQHQRARVEEHATYRVDAEYELVEMLSVEFNIEGNPFAGPEGDYPGFMEIVHRAKPAPCTLVPDAPGQLTSDHGWDIERHGGRVAPLLDELKALGVRVSLFMDPDCEQIARAADVGADRVELYTEPYARAFERGEAQQAVEEYAAAAKTARNAGLGVNAGHDLNLANLATFRSIGDIDEVSIGHALMCEALEMGLTNTVKAYIDVLS